MPLVEAIAASPVEFLGIGGGRDWAAQGLVQRQIFEGMTLIGLDKVLAHGLLYARALGRRRIMSDHFHKIMLGTAGTRHG